MKEAVKKRKKISGRKATGRTVDGPIVPKNVVELAKKMETPAPTARKELPPSPWVPMKSAPRVAAPVKSLEDPDAARHLKPQVKPTRAGRGR